MAYTTLLVALTLGGSNRSVLLATREIARRTGAGVLGVTASRPIAAVYADLPMPAKLFDEERKQNIALAGKAEREFRSVLAGDVARLEWRVRTAARPVADQLVHEARSADLVVVGAPEGEPYALSDATRTPDIGDLVMSAARPVVVVPATPPATAPKRILIGWKDTPECQRAIADAEPLLAKAEDVVLAGFAPPAELEETGRQMTEVKAWLAHKGVKARLAALPANGANARQFEQLADECRADLLVVGAFGHLRQTEWVLGGVTEALLRHPKRPTLFSR